jgi:hypothetical protein
MPLVHDTISFCHPEGSLGWTFGFLQLAPWLVSAAFFFAPHSQNDALLRMIALGGHVLALLAAVLRTHIADPVPDPACRDIFDTAFGLPVLNVVLVTFYAAAFLMYYRWWPRAPPLSVYARARTVALIALVCVALQLNGLNSARQLVLSVLLGAVSGILYTAWLRSLVAARLCGALANDPDGLGMLFGDPARLALPDVA